MRSLISANSIALTEGRNLLERLDQEKFVSTGSPLISATIGEHFRHVLEHYQCLFEQLDQGVICYDERSRNFQLQTDYEYCLDTLDAVLSQLENLSLDDFSRPLKTIDCQCEEAVDTSLQRELLFLQSHTTHHYALIAVQSRAHGVIPQTQFGVAIATRQYQEESMLCAQ